MPNYYLLPITHTDFLDWYNRRHKAYSALKFIPAVVKEGEADMPKGWERVLLETLPDYEEDFQVLVALLDVERERKYREDKTIGERVPACQSIDICDIQRLYPITQRGARMLEVRLPPNVTLGPPIFEDAIRAQEQECLRNQQRAGGDVLLEMFDLKMHEGEVEPLKEEILDAVHAKITRQNERPPSTLLEAVIRYDRQDKPSFPTTPIGTLLDYLEILKVHLRRWYKNTGTSKETGEQIRDLFKKAGKASRNMGRDGNPYEAINDDVLSASFRELDNITDLDFDRCPPKAAILYLDIRGQLREDDSLQHTTLRHWAETLKAAGEHRSLAIGLWTVGAFFGFSTFADAYYENQDASFLRDFNPEIETEANPEAEVETSP